MKSYYKNLDTDKLTKLKKVELAKLQEIKLSLVGDAEQLLSDARVTLRNMGDAKADGREAKEQLESAFSKAQMAFEQVDEAIDEQADDYNRIDDMIGELRKGADALGMDVEDIPIYKDLVIIQDDIGEQSDELEDLFTYFENAL